MVPAYDDYLIMAGQGTAALELVTARLGQDLPANGPRETYRDAILENAGGSARVDDPDLVNRIF